MAGSIAWALRDFRVEAGWQGGAPLAYATAPWNNKSLIEQTNREEARVLRAAQALATHEAARLSGPLRCAAVKALLSLAALGSPRARGLLAQLGQRVVRRQRRRQARRRDRMRHRQGPRGARAGQGGGHRRRPPDRPRIVFYLTSGQAEAAQFEGQGEGPEQISSALLLRPRRYRRRAREVERCLNCLVGVRV